MMNGDADHISALYSVERLAALVQLTNSLESAIELHQETLILGGMMMPILASVELALRNSVCDCLSNYFAVDSWLTQPPAPFQWRQAEVKKVTTALDSARRVEYAKMSQAQKHSLDLLAYPNGRPANRSHLQRSKDRRKWINVTHGKVVSELTLYFWKKLYGPDYEQALWRTGLKRTFPEKTVKRSDVAIHLENIYQSRNRLAHHEPVLNNRYKDTVKSLKFVILNLGHSKFPNSTPLFRLLKDDLEALDKYSHALHKKIADFREVS